MPKRGKVLGLFNAVGYGFQLVVAKDDVDEGGQVGNGNAAVSIDIGADRTTVTIAENQVDESGYIDNGNTAIVVDVARHVLIAGVDTLDVLESAPPLCVLVALHAAHGHIQGGVLVNGIGKVIAAVGRHGGKAGHAGDTRDAAEGAGADFDERRGQFHLGDGRGLTRCLVGDDGNALRHTQHALAPAGGTPTRAVSPAGTSSPSRLVPGLTVAPSVA